MQLLHNDDFEVLLLTFMAIFKSKTIEMLSSQTLQLLLEQVTLANSQSQQHRPGDVNVG